MKVSSYTAGGVSNAALGAMNISTSSMNSNVKKTSKNSRKMPKKSVNYNPRELSSALLRASRSRSAGQVLVQARSKLATLAKIRGTGQYNEAQVDAAIAHAKRMVRCAKMKTQNLRQEERMQNRYEDQAKAEARQKKNEAKARIAQKERNLEQKQEIARMQYNQKQKKITRELLQKKKNNRNRENNKIMDADMEYLKQQMRGLREPASSAASFTPMEGVMLELSQGGMELSEAQIEQQVAAMIDSGMAGEMGTGSGISGGNAAEVAVNIGI